MTYVPSLDELEKRFAAAITDPAARAALARELFPDRERLRHAFRPGSDAALDAVCAVFDRIRLPDDAPEVAWATVIDVPSDRTAVRAHLATAAQLADPMPGTPADREFPGGARDIAQRWLAPDRLFFEVTCRAPGATSGTRFHLIFHDGTSWCMAGPLWRFLKDFQAPSEH